MATVTINWTGGMEGSTFIDVDGKDTKIGGEIGYFYFRDIADGDHTANGRFANSAKTEQFTITDNGDKSINLYL